MPAFGGTGMTTQSRFGGTHTEKKLKAIEDYLIAYLRILSKTDFQTVYIDAFAGSGVIPQGAGGELLQNMQDGEALRLGSAIRALKLQKRFDRYIFIEKSPSKLSELKARVAKEVPGADNVTFVQGDAAEEIKNLCPFLKRRNVRSVTFLDPFGSQVSWETLAALAETKHVDLWYLFPSGLSVNRQIPSDRKFNPGQAESLDRLFGPHDWRSRLLKTEEVPDLFGSHVRNERANMDEITRFMIECMSTVFAGDVLKKWLPLGRKDAHWYSLIFAMANSSTSAKTIGHRVARHVMSNS
jgi:three-Cys-motif partner protein